MQKRLILLLIVLSPLIRPAIGLTQDIPGVPYLENENYVVRLTRFERFGPEYSEYRFTFAVQTRSTQRESLMRMHNLTTQLRRAEIIGDVLVVFGAIRNTADVVTILDLERGEEKDSILCYDPKLSETKRYIIYKKFYPRFADAPASSNLVMVYDLQASPLDNRVQADANSLSGRSPEDTGYPVFPEKNVAERSTSVWVEAAQQRHRIYSSAGYLWLDQDRKVLFVDKSAGENWLVLVDLSKGLDNIRIRKKLIDVAAVLSLDPNIHNYEILLQREKEQFSPRELRKTENGRVAIIFRSNPLYKFTKIEMDLPN